MKRVSWRGIGVGVLALLVLAGGACARRSGRAETLVQGEVVVTEVRVAAKVPGRVDALHVREGAQVERGAVLATIDSPEIRAKVRQATAAQDAAEAMRRRAFAGAREEEIRAARSQWERALGARDLAEKSLGRVQRLHADGVVAAQRLDEAEANARVAAGAAEAARAAYDLAMAGARIEEREAVAAQAAQAAGVRAEAEVWLDETVIRSPLAGEVARVMVEVGELAPQGFPVAVVADLNDAWAVFQVREDQLAGVTVGSTLSLRFPALGAEEHAFRVSWISPLGDFATWRATNASEGFDLKSFEVRVRPIAPVPGLRPGMTALTRWPSAAAHR